MAFFEMLPGAGMPSGLQAGMDSVLNKKFGTSTTYPAEGWPYTVNLMGPLPEKTASGPIVTFPDGADAVPLKKCEITLPASLDGYSEVDVVASGKNLLPNTAQTATENGVTFAVNSDGTVSLSGTCNADTNFYIYSGFTFPKLGQYFFSGCPSGGSTSTYRVFLTNYGADVGSGYLLNVSNLSTTTSIRINIKSGVVTDGLVFKPMIEYGTTATTYEPYQTPKTHTASLGRTIYGGTADIVNGTGTENISAPTAINSLTWSKTTVGGHDAFYSNLPNGYIGQGSGMMDADCDTYDITTDSNLGTDKTIRFYYNANFNITRCVIRDDQYASYTGAQFKEAVTGDIVYQLADSAVTTFTFDPVPIDSKLGNNTIWSDSGDTEVTYRADINLALGGN